MWPTSISCCYKKSIDYIDKGIISLTADSIFRFIFLVRFDVCEVGDNVIAINVVLIFVLS